jgi:ubiquinone/menaquinone biosynthesis C-methylase UbiE
MKEWWDERYRHEQFIWDKVPSKCTASSLELLKQKGIKKILDVPCGYGRDTVFLTKNGFDVTGLDRSEEAIKLANSYALEEGLTIDFIQGDVNNIDFPDSSFDAIISNRFLHLVHIDEHQEKVAKELHRVVKDDGLLILTTRSIDDPDCNQKNFIKDNIYELKERPGHTIRFNTNAELKKIFSPFNEITFETLEEPESLDRTVNCCLLKIVAKK